MNQQDRERLVRIKAKIQLIHDGKEGRWFDPGEYESLKQEFFDDEVPFLIETVDALAEESGLQAPDPP